MSQLTFLAADRPLVKAYALDSNNNLTKESYPKAWEFTSHTVEVNNLQEFHAALLDAAAQGWCLLKGNVARPLVCESRAGSTDPHATTWWICLDFDRLPKGVSIKQALDVLRLAGVSYIIQYSASYGIELDRGATAHVFIMLTTPLTPAALKQWLIGLNLSTEMLSTQIALTKSNNALSWPLDVSTCQNDKLIYIAPPVVGPGVQCVEAGDRIQLVANTSVALDPAVLDIPTITATRMRTESALDVLRTKLGMPSRKWSYKTDAASGLEVLSKPDAATLTGLKKERGFVYFNLNGGDSWGYYHADDTPQVIRNFKGEQNYLTAELLPEYWAGLKSDVQSTESLAPGAKQLLTFCDQKSALYYKGFLDIETNELELFPAKTVKQLQDFRITNGLAKVEVFEDWDLINDPASNVRVDTVAKTINLFAPSQYMKQTDTKNTTLDACPVISKLLIGAVGPDETLRDHFLNWFACIFVLRQMCGTAWALHGIQGTGKGLLVNRVMVPLLGIGNVAIKRMEELEDKFNGFAQRALLVVIDEAQISESRKSRMLMANLKNMITEPTITVRNMHSAAFSVPNFSSWMFLTNQTDPVTIELTDRRFNVGHYQKNRLEITPEEVAAIEGELPAFASFLHNYAIDIERARTVLQTTERDDMIAAGTNSIDTTTQAINAGDLAFFWEALPAGELGMLKPEVQAMHDSYTRLLHDALRLPPGEVHKLTREELYVLIAYNVGDVPVSPAKFTRYLRLHRLTLKNIRHKGSIVRGIEIGWEAEPTWIQERLEELQTKQPTLKIVGGTTIVAKQEIAC